MCKYSVLEGFGSVFDNQGCEGQPRWMNSSSSVNEVSNT